MNQEEIDFWAEVEALLNPPKENTIEYRLYYNELGKIYYCAMLEQDYIEGAYLVVDQATYENYNQYYVSKGALKVLDLTNGNRVQLIKSDRGYRVVAGHANIVLDDNETYSDIEFYEQIN